MLAGMTTHRFSILLVGCGKMGRAMLGGWIDQGADPASILVVDPSPQALPPGVHGVGSFADLPEGTTADVVVLAVKPQVMADTAAPYAGLAGPETVFLSIAAGKSLAFYRSILGDVPVVRAMPNTPAAIGRGMTALYAGPGVSAAQKATCETLCAGVGKTTWVPEEALIDAVTAVSGSGPAYVFWLVECMAAAGVDQGLDPDTAMLLARETVAGAGELLFRSPEDAAQLRKNVTSPGGTTAAALEVLMDPASGLEPLMKAACAANRRRSEELSS